MSAEEVKSGATEDDPAEFLLSNSKYHDCHLIVGNPIIDESVERIGVSSTHLIAHSPVFRDMLADSELADPSDSNTHITDVSPATFKLMLRYIYGGELPKLSDEEAVNLALFGGRYKIHRLVEKASKQLTPISEDNIFPALTCVANGNCPTLEVEVNKFIQEETFTILCNKRFLDLDEKCLLVIVKQNMLSITELELWGYLVRWGEHQKQKCPDKKLRGCLTKALKYFRVLTLTVEDIANHVLPTGVLTPKEFVDLTCAIANDESLKSPGLCKNREERLQCLGDVEYFKPNPPYKNVSLKKQSGKRFSTFSIKPSQTVKIDSFTIKNQECIPNSKYDHVYMLDCNITITKSVKGRPVATDCITIRHSAVLNENVTLDFNSGDKEPLILKGPGKYTFSLEFSTPHTVYEVYKTVETEPYGPSKQVDITFDKFYCECMTVKYEDRPHVIGIAYKTTLSHDIGIGGTLGMMGFH